MIDPLTFVLLLGVSQHSAQYLFSGNADDTAGTRHGTVLNAVLSADRFGVADEAYTFGDG